MAVVKVDPGLFNLDSDQRLTIDPDGRQMLNSNLGKRLIVHVDSVDDDQVSIMRDERIPKAGQSYSEANPFLIAAAHRLQRTENPLVWTCDIGFQSFAIDGQQDPLLEPDKAEWDEVDYVKVAQIFTDGRRIQNVNGEKPDTDPVVEDYDRLFIYQTNRATFNTAFYDRFSKTVNLSPFRGYPAGQALMKKIRGTYMNRNGFQYFRMAFQVLCSRKKIYDVESSKWIEVGHQLVIPNVGYKIRPKAGDAIDKAAWKSEKTMVFNPADNTWSKSGPPMLITQPVPLNSDGTERSTSLPLVMLNGYVNWGADWSELGSWAT